MNTWIDLMAAFAIGVLVGLGELVGRYRDEPGRAVRSRPALYYMAINGSASLAALGMAHVFGWTFSAPAGTDQARLTQVLVAGFGAMAVFRSSLFLYRVGSKEIGIGPVAFLQVLLDATDRGVDRHRARARSRWVSQRMDGLTFDEVAISLPLYAIGLMQNLSKQDQEVLSERVDDVRKSPQEDRMKVISLGLLVLDAVGEGVLEEAILVVRKELGHEPPASGRTGLGSISSVFRAKGQPEVPTVPPAAAASAAPPTKMKVADAPTLTPTPTPTPTPSVAPPVAPANASLPESVSPSGVSTDLSSRVADPAVPARSKANPVPKAKAPPKPPSKATAHT